MPNIHIKES